MILTAAVTMRHFTSQTSKCNRERQWDVSFTRVALGHIEGMRAIAVVHYSRISRDFLIV